MESGVKRHFPQRRSQNENILAAQDDRSNVVRRDGLQVVVGRLAELSDMGGGIN